MSYPKQPKTPADREAACRRLAALVDQEQPEVNMDANLTYEIKAEAFRRMTGLMAPGKSVSPLAYSGQEDEDLRYREWQEWNDKYGEVIGHLLAVVQQNREYL